MVTISRAVLDRLHKLSASTKPQLFGLIISGRQYNEILKF